ncbi:3-hydroxyacyl-CoA dehydrogenase/enoyl-CoA hydratase family protein [Paraliomyxa miuraensis]|uniref:3-hydroxyacyl-CoA dehydrogenase/enoyl-CoA hydratase family protein n=1 Tax=Paraliomyxa miuraensis TaxID=376150 RepID=UPI00225AC490|nr:enoyl-CoA hydratase-related protein [Paraliomyxa miuraensis]MCX4245724.1 enoyl-CoA hydratase-related protein [Paraliomyxa miuraensis]
MPSLSDPTLRPLFQPRDDAPVRAVVVAGACGNVGFGKLGQFARLMAKPGVPVVALDLSPAVHEAPDRLRAAFGKRFSPEEIDAIVANVRVVQGGIDDLPKDLAVGFVFEAIPERLDLKHAFYRSVRARDPEAFIFSATSGFPSTMLFEGLPGAERCGVMHPFFPHLTNKLWEVPTTGAVTGESELKTVRRFLAGLGMNLITVKDVPAFAADRIFCGMMLEAVRIHADTGLHPAQIDDVCKKALGTSPFFVHNLIPGANYLSAHCMELMGGEVDSTLFSIPDAWKPYIEDPSKQWPYERGQTCPPERFAEVRDRMLGMLLSLTAGIVAHQVATVDALNFLCENALAFRAGTPALVEELGFEAARDLVTRFVEGRGITHADQVAPIRVFAEDAAPWHEVYVGTAVHGGVGLLSLKRTTLNHAFVAQLDRAYDRLAGDDTVKAIVLAPDGTYSQEFGHGADLDAFVPVLGKEEAALALIERWKRTLGKLRGGKPTVAALVGRVLGGGLELAVSCHARIAGQRTRLAFPETTVGVIPGLGGCHYVHRLVDATHWSRVNEILLTGHGFGVDEAAQWGLVSQVVPIPELPAASMKLAAGLAAGSVPMPAFREGPATVQVSTDVATTNEAGVPLDAELRTLLVSTIIDANGAEVADGGAIEARGAARSLAGSSSKIGVQAMLRGKPPQFEHPLS